MSSSRCHICNDGREACAGGNRDNFKSEHRWNGGLGVCVTCRYRTPVDRDLPLLDPCVGIFIPPVHVVASDR